MYKHKKLRDKAPEIEALKLGTGCSQKDFDKPFLFLSATAGDSHPGSVHLLDKSLKIRDKINEQGKTKAFNYYATDICDGMAQGHEGMFYSLPSRDMICNMIELQGLSSPFDYGLYTSSCDKGIPGSIMAMCRVDIPSIFMPGGVMKVGRGGITLEQVGEYNVKYINGEINDQEFMEMKQECCPSAGACSFMGTASTMQVITEALGLALPGTALIPTHTKAFVEMDEYIMEYLEVLKQHNLKPSDIVTEQSIKNALVIHAAIAGSTNVLIHMPAICEELGVKYDPNWINEINAKIPPMINIRPTGIYGSEYFWYCGGVYKLIEQLGDLFDVDQLTVTGKTFKENMQLDKLKQFREIGDAYLKKYKLSVDDVISKPNIHHDEHILCLKGNIAETGSIVKASGLSKKMHNCKMTIAVFDTEQDATSAIVNDEINDNTAIIVRYCGPGANGMPEMFYLTETLASNPRLSETCTLITDGRFSGASRGPIIGHVSPEAIRGGLIAYVCDGDILEINIENRSINVYDSDGNILDKNMRVKSNKSFDHKGLLKVYCSLATDAMSGGIMKGYDEN